MTLLSSSFPMFSPASLSHLLLIFKFISSSLPLLPPSLIFSFTAVLISFCTFSPPKSGLHMASMLSFLKSNLTTALALPRQTCQWMRFSLGWSTPPLLSHHFLPQILQPQTQTWNALACILAFQMCAARAQEYYSMIMFLNI